jgi:BirA family biotin operon repressor/biotin-[acetyl-CoA-carboxylase] ligase
MRWRMQRHEELSSTIDAARSAAERGGPEGTVVLAARQTAGRGRRGRRWASPGGGLWVSALLRPQFSPRKLAGLGLAVGLAAAEAVEQRTGLAVGLKWPNDLQVKGRKLGGVLLDSRRGAAGFVIASLGLNVNIAREAFSPELRNQVTSVFMETGEKIGLEGLLRAFLARLEGWYTVLAEWEGEELPPALLAAWRRRDVCLGRRVKVRAAGRETEGLARGLDRTGALRLESDAEGELRLTAGEITWVKS